ncbi:MAG: transcriptional regulator [Phycisphaerales bacterium]|jgi:ribosome-binding protein aMBF1 (putative translation factor)|nr:transcriptional regulator [Phycisphaerales bacterium]
MIRTENEYRSSLERIEQIEQLLKDQEKKLAAEGLRAEQIKRALDPSRVLHEQVKEEVESYQRLKKGRFEELRNLHGVGQMLIGVRIALGLSQRELAEKIGVHESQVSRDERNEYFGVTVERAARILDALGVEMTTRVKMPSLAKSA